jgi:outer membrane lipoprotein-sorting protein
MNQRVRLFVAALAGIGALAATVGRAGPAEEKGLDIAREADRRYSGYQDCTANLRMILRDRQGRESRRDLRVRMLEVANEGTRSLCIFDSPMDVKGTILLTHTHPGEDDDQWLFLPALKRVKRIAASNKSGSFMGSEFAYEDIGTQHLEKYTYKWLRDEAHDGYDCYVIERHPVDERNSGYIRQVVWIDKQEYRTLKVDYYDRKDSLLKTLTFKGWKRHLDEFWRAREMNMVNHQTGKSSRLIWTELEFRNGLTENDFHRHILTRIR